MFDRVVMACRLHEQKIPADMLRGDFLFVCVAIYCVGGTDFIFSRFRLIPIFDAVLENLLLYGDFCKV